MKGAKSKDFFGIKIFGTRSKDLFRCVGDPCSLFLLSLIKEILTPKILALKITPQT